MSGAFALLRRGLLLCAVALPAQALPLLDQNLLWTNPVQPLAGAPLQLLFETNTVQGFDYAFEQALLEGDSLVLVYRETGTLVGSDVVLERRVLVAEHPALDAGTYAVSVRLAGGDGSVDQDVGTLEVVASGATADVIPAEGFWSNPQQPGSGLFLERRGGLLSVALYSYNDHRNLQPGWWLGSGTSTTDTWLAPLLEFHQGSCLGCVDHVAPDTYIAADAMRLRFESARRALIDINGNATVAVVSTPYGADYLDVALVDSVDATWGPLPLPDLRGEWVFAIEEADARKNPLRLRFDILEHTDGAVVFRAGEDARLTCRSASAERRAGCEYEWTGLVFSSPPPMLYPTDPAWFALGDIEEDRMRGTVTIGEQEYHVRAFRVPVADPATAIDGDAAH